MNTIVIAVPAALRGCVGSGLARVGYLYPDIECTFDSETSEIRVQAGNGVLIDGLRSEILYHLYREKVFLETLPVRRRLYGDV